MDNHVILTLGRSGSNTLSDLLNQNPAVLNFGEVLGDWNVIRKAQRRMGLYRGDDRAYLDAVLGNRAVLRAANTVRTVGKLRHGARADVKSLNQVSTVGFKEFAIHFIRLDIYDYLKARPHLKVIGLTRTNVVDRMISNAFLERTGLIALKTGDGTEQTEKLWIDPDTVLDQLDVIERENNELRRMLEVLPEQNVFWVGYDDLFADQARTTEIVRDIYAFLGVPDHMPRVRMRKILKRDPLQALANGAELREVISGSRFAMHLHGAPLVAEDKRRADQQNVRAALLDA